MKLFVILVLSVSVSEAFAQKPPTSSNRRQTKPFDESKTPTREKIESAPLPDLKPSPEVQEQEAKELKAVTEAAAKLGLGFTDVDQAKLSKKATTILNRNMEPPARETKEIEQTSGFRIFEKDLVNRRCELTVPKETMLLKRKLSEEDTWTFSKPKIPRNRPTQFYKGTSFVEWDLISSRGSKITMECRFTKEAKPIIKDEEPDVTILPPAPGSTPAEKPAVR